MKHWKKAIAVLLALLSVGCCLALSLCAFAQEDDPAETHVHQFENPVVVLEPTCTTEGKTMYTCACGETEIRTEPASGHTWGNWKVLKPATATEEGLKERTCRNDPSHKEYQTIPKTESGSIGQFFQKIVARFKAFFENIMRILYRD